MRNERGSALLIVIILGFLVALLSMVTFMSTRNSTRQISQRRLIVSAFNIAEAGKEHAIAQIRSDILKPIPGAGIVIFNAEPFEQGCYTVTYDADVNLDTMWIHSTGTLEAQTARVDVVCALNRVYTDIDVSVEAAVTALSNVDVTGNFIVDGRDWNQSGDTVLDDGVFGVKSCSSIACDGSAEVGGKGHAPTSTLSTDIVSSNASSVGYPQSPEQFLGLTAGSLDAYKVTSLPSMPFHGIIYYSPSGSFNCPNLSGSTGIFICHNSSLTASMKNIDGDFKGLIISDRIDHVNANSNLLGAVVTLSGTSGTNAFGNGNANLKYSSAVLENIVNSYSVLSDTTVDVVSWMQSK